jgi:hypothetical protein
MANYYWVGGTGTWDSSSTTNWASTSGGAGGAGVPTAADNAYFDDESDTGAAFTVTIGTGAVCKDVIIGDGATVDALDQTMTLAGSAAWTISGSLFFPATNFTITYNGAITFNATTTGKTITANGNVITSGAVTINGVGGEWSLQSTATFSAGFQTFSIQNGTFNTNNYNLTVTTLNFQPGATVNLGSSIVTVTHGANNVLINSSSTFNAGTSTINIINSVTQSVSWGNKTYYNVAIIAGTFTINDSNTFNNLTFNAPSSANIRRCFISEGQTINGTLDISSANTNPTFRNYVLGGTFNTAITLTCNAVSIGEGVDFRDITIAGAAAPFDASAKSTGDCGGNSGITFPAPKTVYWNLAGSRNWSETAWATTPTGTPADANFPLAQDTAVVTEAGAAGTIAINAAWNIGTLTFDDGVSTRTSAATLNFSSGPTFYSDLKLSSGTIISGTAGMTFAGLNTQNITGAGKTFTNGITLDSPGGTLVLQDNLTLGTDRTFTLTRGTLDLNGKVLSCGSLACFSTTNKSIDFKSGKIQITGNNTTVLNFGGSTGGGTNFSCTGTPIVELTYTGSTGARTLDFRGGGITQNTVLDIKILGGSDVIGMSGSSASVPSYFGLVEFFSAFSGSIGGSNQVFVAYKDVILSPNMTVPSTGMSCTFANESIIQNFRSNNVVFNGPIIKTGAGTLRLEDNLTMGSTRRFTHTGGTVNLNGRNLSCNDYSSSNSNIRNLTFGSGQILLQGTGTVWNMTATNMTITPGTGKIVLADNSNTARTFAGGGITTYPELEIGGDTGTATTTITGSNRFRRLTNSKLVAYTIVFPNAITSVDDWNLNGSEGNLITLSRTGGSGTFTINYSGTSYGIGRFLSISNSTATPTNRMFAINSTDGGSNTGWIFDAPKFGQFLTFFAPPI